MRRWGLIAAFLLLGLAVAAPASGNSLVGRSRLAAPSLSVTPGTGKPGKSFTVSGGGFSYASGAGVVDIRMNGIDLTPGGVPVAADGTFSTKARVPELPAGTYTVEAVGEAPEPTAVVAPTEPPTSVATQAAPPTALPTQAAPPTTVPTAVTAPTQPDVKDTVPQTDVPVPTERPLPTAPEPTEVPVPTCNVPNCFAVDSRSGLQPHLVTRLSPHQLAPTGDRATAPFTIPAPPTVNP